MTPADTSPSPTEVERRADHWHKWPCDEMCGVPTARYTDADLVWDVDGALAYLSGFLRRADPETRAALMTLYRYRDARR